MPSAGTRSRAVRRRHGRVHRARPDRPEPASPLRPPLGAVRAAGFDHRAMTGIDHYSVVQKSSQP